MWNSDDAEVRRLLSMSPLRIHTPESTVPFGYSPLHDMESMWWIAVYFVIERQVVGTTTVQDPRDLLAQRTYGREVFRQDGKYSALLGNTSLERLTPQLHPAMQPVACLLEDLRKQLLAAFHAAEKDKASIDHTVADGLHQSFSSTFARIAQWSSMQNIELLEFDGQGVDGERTVGQAANGPSNRTVTSLPPPSPRTILTRSRKAALDAAAPYRYNLRSRKVV